MLVKAANEELARRDFSHFVKLTFENYQMGWFHKRLCDALQKFYDDVCDGKCPRLMIFAPPRHGKSQLFSRHFPAWCIGKSPKIEILACSHTSSLASDMNRDVQRIIEHDRYKDIFPYVGLTGRKNSEEFEIFNEGVFSGKYKSAGVGGAITGLGADIAIIDDPVKDGAEANSSVVRASILAWYQTTFHTRLSPKGGILFAMTRWHEDDLAGRLIRDAQREGEERGEQWDILSFPAIAEKDEEDRKIGEALDTNRYSLEKLLSIKRMKGPHYWGSLYQQNPQSDGTLLIKSSWFKRYTKPPLLEYKIIVADTAQKQKEHNDYSVFQCWGLTRDKQAILLDQIRGKWDSVDLQSNAISFWNKHSVSLGREALRGMYIEDKVSGTGLIQQIKRAGQIPIYEIKAEKDKLTRLYDVQGFIESGYIFVPESAPWILDFFQECEALRADMKHNHDDQVDAMVYAISILLGLSKGMNLDNYDPAVSMKALEQFMR